MQEFSLNLEPISIGGITISPPLLLAPMAGHTHHAFRTLCRDMGGVGLVCTELISSNVMKHSGVKRAMKMFDWTPDELPFAVQLFGNDPDAMALAARVVADHGADIVDINMGCWVPKVAGKGGGAALLKDVPTATAVVEAVVNAVDVPVTVKVRSGWDVGDATAIPFAIAAENAGVKAIAVHGRFAKQGFQGDADWDIIRQVKEVVHIPVFGNGGIHNAADAQRMMRLTGCDGVMIGRAALGQPWIFQHIAHELATGEALPEPTRAERAAIALEHAHRVLSEASVPERVAVMELRGQLAKYALDEPGSVTVRNEIVRTESLADIEMILVRLMESDPTPVL